MDCIFCKVVAGEIPAEIIYQDDLVVAFSDVEPQAPIHKLIVPRRHIATLNDVQEEDSLLLGHMAYVAQRLAKQLDIDGPGYRLIMNCNDEGGQSVHHLHMHLLGGRQLSSGLG